MVNGMAGILTARHVWDEIARAQTLALLVGGRPYYLNPQLLRVLGPEGKETLPDVGVKGPDIALVCIPTVERVTIEASNKVFYSLDIRRKDSDIELFAERGFWILAGSPQELFDPDTTMVASFLYDTTLDRRVEIGAWDYLIINLDLEKNPQLPKAYGGVSGGGIWRAAFYVNEDETEFVVEKPSRDIVLSGVAFRETPPQGRQIVGHGPKSLYHTLPDHCVRGVT